MCGKVFHRGTPSTHEESMPPMPSRDVDHTSFYDREWADPWKDMKLYSPVARHTRRLIRKHLDRLSYESLIDIGCGSGELLRELALDTTSIAVAGIDLSSVAIDLAKRRSAGRFHQLDIQRSWVQETYDVGICSEVLEHLPDDVAALRNIRRMCHRVVITVPSGPLRPSSIAMGHLRHYSREGLAAKLVDAGFSLLSLSAWGTPFHDPIYAWIRGKAPEGSTTGHYGPGRRLASSLLHAVFYLNLFDRGHKLFALAERADVSRKSGDHH
jgi:SAM-dependent methyltransferase